jgi:hypothetical protein
MPVVEFAATIRRCAAACAVLALGSLAGACSSDRIFGSGQTSSSGSAPSQDSPSIASRMANLVLQKPPQPTAAERQAQTAAAAATICPPLDVRAGASTLTVPPGNTDAFALRYQGSISEMARECSVSGGLMRMKVGIEGRLLVGPAGGAGQLEVPLRFAVVREGPEPKTVISKFSKVAVTIPEGSPNVIFTHVDSDIAFPMPDGLEIEAYVVYVGFDPLAEKQQPKKPQAKPRR